MARLSERTGLSPMEHLEWERNQPARHEYFRGDVFAMAGGSPRHNALCAAIVAALHGVFRERGCAVLSSDQRLGMDDGERYVYADVTVVRGEMRLQSGTTDVVSNPSVVVEVLSASTEQYDRGLKWEGYQRVESLTDYLLVSQSEPRVEHFKRESDGSWVYRAAGAEGAITLTAGVGIEVGALFAGVLDIVGD